MHTLRVITKTSARCTGFCHHSRSRGLLGELWIMARWLTVSSSAFKWSTNCIQNNRSVQNIVSLQTNCQTWGLTDIRPKPSERSHNMTYYMWHVIIRINSYGSALKALWFFNALKALWLDVTQQLLCHSPQENHPTETSAHRKLNPEENRPTRKLPRWNSSHRIRIPRKSLHREIIPQENHARGQWSNGYDLTGESSHRKITLLLCNQIIILNELYLLKKQNKGLCY